MAVLAKHNEVSNSRQAEGDGIYLLATQSKESNDIN
jgi:hypothetical protein